MDDSKKCNRCLEIKPLDLFFRCKRSPDGRENACKACDKARKSTPEQAARIKQYWADRYKATKDSRTPAQVESAKRSVRLYARRWRESNRAAIFKIYGGKCNACGESDPIVLDVDHVNDDGASHRAERGFGQMLMKDILDSGYCPERFQLLCKNCNWRKEYARRIANRTE
jgi:hypothetical protein